MGIHDEELSLLPLRGSRGPPCKGGSTCGKVGQGLNLGTFGVTGKATTFLSHGSREHLDQYTCLDFDLQVGLQWVPSSSAQARGSPLGEEKADRGKPRVTLG